MKKLEKILENPAKLKEKMTNDFNEALSVIDSNADKMISPREFNEYQVKTYLKNLLIDVFSWEKDIAAKKRPVGSPLYKRLESEANEIIKAAEIQLKKKLKRRKPLPSWLMTKRTKLLKISKRKTNPYPSQLS